MEESRLKNIEEAITSLSQQMNQRFDQVDQRFEENSAEHSEFRQAIEEARKDREELWLLTVAEFRRFDQKFEDQGRYFEILLENQRSDMKLFRESFLGHSERLEDHEDRIARLEQSA